MPLYRFKENDIFHNRIKAHPRVEFFIHSGSVYYNKRPNSAGSFSNSERSLSNDQASGSISLFEINIDRTGSVDGHLGTTTYGYNGTNPLIFPFVTKDGALTAFKTITTSDFMDSSQFAYGDVIKGSYPLSASLSIRRYLASSLDQSHTDRPHVHALKNTLEYIKSSGRFQ